MESLRSIFEHYGTSRNSIGDDKHGTKFNLVVEVISYNKIESYEHEEVN